MISGIRDRHAELVAIVREAGVQSGASPVAIECLRFRFQTFSTRLLRGRKGLSISGSDDDLELCRTWGTAPRNEGWSTRLVFDHDVLVPAWIESETPAISWDRLRVLGFFEIGSTNEEAVV